MIDAGWLQSFPLQRAQDVTEALLFAWRELASKYRPNFHRDTHEPNVTRVLTDRAVSVSRQRGISGKWLPEVVINVVDQETAEIKEERRADIVYFFHGHNDAIELVFEFKLLRRSGYAAKWIGEDGVRRFVDGQYSKNQAAAVIVGVLDDDRPTKARRIRDALEGAIEPLGMQPHADGTYFAHPSFMTPAAEYDTVHLRPTDLAPPHGTIVVSHIIIEFGY